MNISVVIPTFNSAATIEATLKSVLAQTMAPDEIIVLDDGSTDETCSILAAYAPRVSIVRQTNKGVASARNALAALAKGRLIAFLDHDDLWHPRYLEAQWIRFENHTEAKAFFAGHVNFCGYGYYDWSAEISDVDTDLEVIEPMNFFMRRYKTSGFFDSASFLCVPKLVLSLLGQKPFHEQTSGVDDYYLCCNLALMGPVVYAPAPLVAYRYIKEAQSVDKVKACRRMVDVFQYLQQESYEQKAGSGLSREFRRAFAMHRRSYAKRLMSISDKLEARNQLIRSIGNSAHAVSIAKSLGLLVLTFMPRSLQPKWPSSQRQWIESA